MNNAKKWLQVKEQCDRLQKQADRAQGAWEQLLEEISSQFDCNTIEDAQKLEKILTKKIKTKQELAHQEIEQFLDEFGEKLGVK